MTMRCLLIIAGLRLAASLGSAQHCPKIEIDQSSGFCTVPDPALTPGEMDPAFACVSNQERPRSVTASEKKAILAAYGYPANTDKSTREFDLWLAKIPKFRTHLVVCTMSRVPQFKSPTWALPCGAGAEIGNRESLLLITTD
jgi:hypothetical protein